VQNRNEEGSMSIIGKVELESNKAANSGEETTLLDLFTFEERSKKFNVDQGVKREQKLKIHLEKISTIEATSDSVLPTGFPTSIATLLKWTDENKKFKVAEPIKKGSMVEIAVEN
jgi:hypothetical protein